MVKFLLYLIPLLALILPATCEDGKAGKIGIYMAEVDRLTDNAWLQIGGRELWGSKWGMLGFERKGENLFLLNDHSWTGKQITQAEKDGWLVGRGVFFHYTKGKAGEKDVEVKCTLSGDWKQIKDGAEWNMVVTERGEECPKSINGIELHCETPVRCAVKN
ncbi:uncharacterized protein MKK02DRAFT_30579 [Dioszegia hungarica]|uniref:Uncharacterized protein n=1 Tax=Dioszegia hungarica TaxID=4972 RepID=A0AA38LTQ5_9TREE|nr:uncharacterized protein MKK02DRAFT_30579 [Dioszegia hungarica]KAI9632851.1 hypothetical protein MKK02DRAFT_30579 [Dioszegia hungarica]